MFGGDNGMVIVLVLSDAAGNTRSVTVNAGEELSLQAGEVIDSIVGVDLSQVDIQTEGGALTISWPEGSISLPDYAVRIGGNSASSESADEQGADRSGGSRDVAAGPGGARGAPVGAAPASSSLLIVPLEDGSGPLPEDFSAGTTGGFGAQAGEGDEGGIGAGSNFGGEVAVLMVRVAAREIRRPAMLLRAVTPTRVTYSAESRHRLQNSPSLAYQSLKAVWCAS
jgi:hypothetical protein